MVCHGAPKYETACVDSRYTIDTERLVMPAEGIHDEPEALGCLKKWRYIPESHTFFRPIGNGPDMGFQLCKVHEWLFYPINPQGRGEIHHLNAWNRPFRLSRPMPVIDWD